MCVRRLLAVAALLTSTVVAACGSSPTGIDPSQPTMPLDSAARKDHIPWH